MRVDIWSDVVCPWCYLGQARFEKALAAFGGRDEVEVVYHSFELDPSWPAGQTMPVLEMLATKYHLSPAGAEAAEGRVGALIRAEGLPFRADRPLGNTFDVHRVLHLARDQGLQHRLLEAVHRAYFGQAANVFDPEMLAQVAATAGLDPGDVQRLLDGEDYAGEVRQDEEQARSAGITGVPCYVLDGRLAISGAQSAGTFSEALQTLGESGR
ncbi:MAG TPA: DsbA family oxidoreductase [Streptosporangiaceae bacterium]